MEDPPLTRAELAELKRIRIGKPPSYAAPKDAYRNAIFIVKYQKEMKKKIGKL